MVTGDQNVTSALPDQRLNTRGFSVALLSLFPQQKYYSDFDE